MEVHRSRVRGKPADDDLPEADGRTRFAGLLAEAFAPVRVKPLAHDPFHSAVRSAVAGDVRVSVVTGSPCVVSRGSDVISARDPALLMVAMPRTGPIVLEQDGRRCLVEPGGLVNYVTSRPYELTLRETYEMVVVAVPLAALGSHADGLSGRTAVAVATDSGPRDVVATLFATLAAKIDDCTNGDANCSKEYLADAIVSLTIAQLVDIPAQGAGEDLADRILAYSLAHLSDPELTVDSVARAHAVSSRYLHKVLEPRGVTLSAWIRTQRLERIHRDLADESLRGRTVVAVATRWGMTDAGHLSRALKAEFGVTASEIRRLGRRDRAGTTALHGVGSWPSRTGPGAERPDPARRANPNGHQ